MDQDQVDTKKKGNLMSALKKSMSFLVCTIISLIITICLTANGLSGWQLMGMSKDAGLVVGPATIAISVVGIIVALVAMGLAEDQATQKEQEEQE
jgi:type III secretory pathway component EscU